MSATGETVGLAEWIIDDTCISTILFLAVQVEYTCISLQFL